MVEKIDDSELKLGLDEKPMTKKEILAMCKELKIPVISSSKGADKQ